MTARRLNKVDQKFEKHPVWPLKAEALKKGASVTSHGVSGFSLSVSEIPPLVNKFGKEC